jgi:ABC-type sugar transport system permease subunit
VAIAFLAPALVGFIAFYLVPAVRGLYLSFTDWNLLSDPEFVGLDNYRDLLADSIYAGTDHVDEAWEWVKFLASTDCQDIVGEHAVVFPAISSSTEIATQQYAEAGIDAEAFTVHVDGGPPSCSRSPSMPRRSTRSSSRQWTRSTPSRKTHRRR